MRLVNQRHRPRRLHSADAEGVGQQEGRHRPAERDDAADSRRRTAAVVNSHTFISFTNAIQTDLCDSNGAPGGAAAPRDAGGAAEERRRLRHGASGLIKSKRRPSARRGEAHSRPSPVHDGLRLPAAGVWSGSRGRSCSRRTALTPVGGGACAIMVKLLQRENIRVVFTEETFPRRDAEGC